ncbi:MAG TPA: hypothetical protein VIL30_02260 [Ramlibacter sp.]
MNVLVETYQVGQVGWSWSLTLATGVQIHNRLKFDHSQEAAEASARAAAQRHVTDNRYRLMLATADH